MTAPRTRVPLSAVCYAADHLDVPEGHRMCPGNRDQRLPGQDPAEPPVQTYRCGCPCHQDTP